MGWEMQVGLKFSSKIGNLWIGFHRCRIKAVIENKIDAINFLTLLPVLC